ncbi:MAG: S1/P1 Nuclease [Cyclobacteriaceae bacterium]
MLRRSIALSLLFLSLLTNRGAVSDDWGFHSHQLINRLSVFTLPPEMLMFYKANIGYLTKKAVNPDMRRYIDPDEGARHYIDLDVYGDSAVFLMPRYWSQAIKKYTEDTLKKYGIVPWHIMSVKNYLTKAFANQDAAQILRLSADLGHYIGDANVPLHTTENYNGQLTGQYGIHGFWESRLPELYAEEYDYYIGTAKYLVQPQLTVWEAIASAHEAVDSVLLMEKELSLGINKKYNYETRGSRVIKVYSEVFSEKYHHRLNGMVERQMRRSIQMIGDFWYTCWVDGGQPNLSELLVEIQEEPVLQLKGHIRRRHESGTVVKE